MICGNRCNGVCSIATQLAGCAVTPHESACRFCSERAIPQQGQNEVVVSLALGAADQAGDKEAVRRIMAQWGHLLRRESGPANAARMAAIEAGRGVGSQIWRLLASLGIKHTAVCKCLAVAEEMNALGPDGCRLHRARLAATMQKNAASYGWGDVARAAGLALLKGLAWRLNIRDLYGSLIDEGINRAKLAGDEAPAAIAATQPAATTAPATPQAKPRQQLLLTCKLCPGDILTMTAAVESLHQAYPGEYVTDVRTPHGEIWANNPRIEKLSNAAPVRTIEMHYPSIQRCNQESVPFLAGYTEYLGEQLGRPLRLRVNRPYLFLSQEERGRPLSSLWPGAPDLESLAGGRQIWLVNAGLKPDYTIKGWPLEHYQEVIDRTKHLICWAQIGLRKHSHSNLRGVVNLIDGSRPGPPMRETILLAARAAGGLGPVTFLQHLMAAWQKPYVCLVGGREPATWVQYPYQHTLHQVGRYDCCREKSCWRARVVPLGDGDAKDKSLCEHPVTEGLERPAAKCMADILPSEVVLILERVVGA
jgi:hypothetical protein